MRRKLRCMMKKLARIRALVRPTSAVAAVLVCMLAAAGLKAQPGACSVAGSGDGLKIVWRGGVGECDLLHSDGQVESALSLTFLHVDKGPSAAEPYLAWFLARNSTSAVILWLYLGKTGNSFWCWLYRYPHADVTAVLLTGSYQFDPAAAHGEHTRQTVALAAPPQYLGDHFTYANIASSGGTLAALPLYTSVENEVTPNPSTPSGPPAATLNQVKITPLSDVVVGGANGWQQNGWMELHCIATTPDGRTWYLVMYSNSTRGYAIDLGDAQLYTADYGAPVQFDTVSDSGAGVADQQISRWSVCEVRLASSHVPTAESTPFLWIRLTRPDGATIRLQGFWKGGDSWAFRFVPSITGVWSYTTSSYDSGLNGVSGTLPCTSSAKDRHGYIEPQNPVFSPQQFQTADGAFWLPRPVAVQSSGGSVTSTLVAFTNEVHSLAGEGFNWLMAVGGSKPDLIEAGLPPLWHKSATPDVAAFAELDRRAEICAANGLVISLAFDVPADADATTLANFRRRFLYMVSRYGAFDVCWVLRTDGTGAGHRTALSLAETAASQQAFPHPFAITSLPQATTNTPAEAFEVYSGRVTELTSGAEAHPTLVALPLQSGDNSAAMDGIRPLYWSIAFHGAAPFPVISSESGDSAALEMASACSRFLAGTDLNHMQPEPNLLVRPATADHAPSSVLPPVVLANTGLEVAAYLPLGGSVELDMLEAAGTLRVRWFQPQLGTWGLETTVPGGRPEVFRAPGSGDWAVDIVRE
ncbi:MAG: DUF5060 domain-containing protein [Armatimonadetes bacterium]|nr:DUF5060 domain-containing protein [Armatimonadota bacterium]MDE2207753.1 DUF5060 domain-containing protein [Armatimonadota bacterium]